jgi:hypothetical protein
MYAGVRVYMYAICYTYIRSPIVFKVLSFGMAGIGGLVDKK